MKKLMILTTVSMTVVLLSLIFSFKRKNQDDKNPVVENHIVETVNFTLSNYDRATEMIENSNSQQIADSVMKYSEKYNVPIYVIYAVIFTESGYDYHSRKVNQRAESKKHCRGLMQISKTALMEFNWKTNHNYSFDSMFEVEKNIEVGCWFFAERYKGFYNDWSEAYVLFNSGFGNFTQGQKEPTEESKKKCREKVNQAITRYEQFEQLMYEEFEI